MTDPAWARGMPRASLCAFLLAGAWGPSHPPDCKIISELGGEPDQVQNLCVRLHEQSLVTHQKRDAVSFGGPPDLREFWAWGRHQEAFRQLAHLLTPGDLDRLARIVPDVLSMVEATGPSRHIHAGLASTVALLGNSEDWLQSSCTPSRRAAAIVSALLAPASPAGRERWTVLAPHLPLLAEAAPDFFLEAVEQCLSSEAEMLQSNPAAVKPLVAALETLAWNVAWLQRAALALAGLAGLERLGEPSRDSDSLPLRSLGGMLGYAMPQTNASIEARLSALGQIRQRHPAVCFRLLIGELRGGKFLHQARRPVFLRLPLPSRNAPVYNSEVYSQIESYLAILMDLAGTDGDRWAELLRRATALPGSLEDRILSRCEALTGQMEDPHARVWASLRSRLHWMGAADASVQKHKPWQDRLHRTEVLYEKFTPADPTLRHAWLFSNEYSPRWFSDHQEEAAYLADARQAALAEVGQLADPWGALACLAENSTSPGVLAHALAKSDLATPLEERLFSQHTFAPYEKFAVWFLALRLGERVFAESATLIRRLVQEGRIEDAADLSRSIGGDRLALLWDLLDDLGGPLRAAYWGEPGYRFIFHERPSAITERAILRLLEYDRVDEALHVATIAKDPIPTELALQILERVALRQMNAQRAYEAELARRAGSVQEQVAYAMSTAGLQRGPDDPHAVAELLKKIQPEGAAELRRARAVEAQLIRFLDYSGYEPRHLTSEIRSRPESLLDLIRRDAAAAKAFIDEWAGYPGDDRPEEEAEEYLYRYGRSFLQGLGDADDSWTALKLLGALLARPRQATVDGIWPGLAARRLLQDHPQLMEFLFFAGPNPRRGRLSIAPSESSEQRRQQAAEYRKSAARIRPAWSNTADLLEQLARSNEGRAADDAAEDRYDRWRMSQMESQLPEIRPLFPLTRMHVENFRAITDLDLSLNPRLTAFYGANASGKTTLLEAMAAGLAQIPGRLLSQEIFPLSRADIHTTWSMNEGARQSTSEKFTRIQLWAQPLRESGKECTWLVEKRYIGAYPASGPQEDPGLEGYLQAIGEALRTDDVQVAVPVFAYYGVERAVGPKAKFDVRPPEEAALRMEGMTDALVGAADFHGMVQWFRGQADLELQERDQKNDRSLVLPSLQAVRRAIEVAVQAPAGVRCQNPRFDRRRNRFLVDYIRQDGGLEELELGQLSDGFRTILALVMDLAVRMVQINPPRDEIERDGWATRSHAVVLIDEIDEHLYPEWQQTVLPSLLEAFPNAQFVITTHSEQVLQSVDDRKYAVYHLVREGPAIVLRSSPIRLYGATSERVLDVAMEVDERPPGEVKQLLSDYQRLVDRDQGESPEALDLRRRLEEIQPEDPALHAADLHMRRKKFFG